MRATDIDGTALELREDMLERLRSLGALLANLDAKRAKCGLTRREMELYVRLSGRWTTTAKMLGMGSPAALRALRKP